MQGILILTNSIGGLHSFRKEVVKAIVDAGHEVVISAPEMVEKAEYFREIGCKIELMPFNRRGMNPLADFKLMMAYKKMMRRLNPKAVLTYTIKPNIYGGMAARLCGVPQLANVTGLGDAVENGGWLKRLTVTLYRMGLGRAYRIFFQNESNRNFCIKMGIADETSVQLPGSGVNLQHHTCQEYPADEGRVRFLYIGRMLKDKGIEEYFATAEKVVSRFNKTQDGGLPQVEFQILGNVEGPFQVRLDDLTARGVVKHLGVTSDVRPFIGAVECTVMPSYHEGMSNVNLESAANGRPVITANVPGCRETVDDGLTGLLCEARSAESLTAIVERFIALPWEQKVLMGKMGREKVEREFDRQIVIDAYLNEINKIAHV
ncbi:MAG: glycosyltransferase family 4 protein [Bacteroidales bacterium]|nr:glycosyltransferase family 4 protein [Bacteroidales bacterium]